MVATTRISAEDEEQLEWNWPSEYVKIKYTAVVARNERSIDGDGSDTMHTCSVGRSTCLEKRQRP